MARPHNFNRPSGRVDPVTWALIALRRRDGRTIKMVGALAKVSPSTISDVETGRRHSYSLWSAIRIARALGYELAFVKKRESDDEALGV